MLIKTKSCCYKIVKYVLGKLTPKFIGGLYKIVLKHMKKSLEKDGKDGYKNRLMSHNQFINGLHVIPMQKIPNKISTLSVGGKADGFPEQSIPVTFQAFLLITCKAISIEQTKETKENGTYQIVIEDVDYEVLTTHLKKLFTALKMNPDHAVTKKSKITIGTYSMHQFFCLAIMNLNLR